MPESVSYRQKTREELSQQLYDVSTVIGTDIVRPSSAEDIYSLNPDDLASVFPIRWKHYVSILREQRSGRNSRGKIAVAAEDLSILNRLDSYLQHHEEVPDDRVLRPRQIEAFQALRDQMEDGRVSYRGYFKLPTRFGKTVLFAELIKVMAVKTLVLVPTRMTGVQAEDELLERVDPQELGRVFGGKHERDRQVTISTYQSLLSDLHHKRIDPYEYGLVIMDEAHLALSPKRREAIGKFVVAKKFGFTATPKYSEAKDLSNFLYPLIYGMSTIEAVQEGILAPFTAYESTVETGTNLTGVSVNSQGDYDESELARAVNNERRNTAAVDIYQKPEFFSKPAFVFCAGIDHAVAMAEKLSETGVTVEVISGRNSLEEQEAIRARFRDGETTILCSADLLTTGINEPCVEVVINARPTLSVVMAEQRGGRVLTLDPNNPGKHAAIIDLVDEDSNGVLYADVVTDAVNGLVSTWGEMQSTSQRKGQFEVSLKVRAMKVNVRTIGILTILEDIQKVAQTMGEHKQKTKLPVSTLVNLLGKPADVIAANLPYYYRGKQVRARQFMQEPIQALNAFSEESDPSIELHINVIQEMILDSVFQRLHGDAILEELPLVVNTLRSKLSQKTLDLPEVASKLALYEQIMTASRSGDLTPSERESLVDSSERVLKDFINIKDEIALSAKDSTSQAIHHELNAGKTALIDYRDSDSRVLIRGRVRKIIQEHPMFVLDFLNSREYYQGTEFYARIKDLLDEDSVINIMDQACAVVFMSKQLPENTISFMREMQYSVRELSEGLGDTRKAVEHWLERLDVISSAAESVEVKDLDPSVLVEGDGYFAALCDDIVELTSLILKKNSALPVKELSQETIKKINKVRNALTAQSKNIKLFRFSIRKALIENPSAVYSLIEQRGSDYILETSLVKAIRNNPNFITLKLRKVQEPPLSET